MLAGLRYCRAGIGIAVLLRIVLRDFDRQTPEVAVSRRIGIGLLPRLPPPFGHPGEIALRSVVAYYVDGEAEAPSPELTP